MDDEPNMFAPMHPRLSLSAITTLTWSFTQDLEFWHRLGLRCVGLFERKLDSFGHQHAIELLQQAGMKCSSVIAHPFSLFDPSRWPEERAAMNRCVDVARVLGGAVYGPPGKGAINQWSENAARYADAVAPCVDYARECGVTLAFEPSLRPNVSFVHNLRDSIELADRSGTAIVIDIGNCYHERDVMAWIDRVGERIAIVQVSDVAIGTIDAPGAGVRGLPGEGELPLRSFLECAIAAGYMGPFEIEFLGTADVDEAAFSRSVAGMNALVSAVTGEFDAWRPDSLR